MQIFGRALTFRCLISQCHDLNNSVLSAFSTSKNRANTTTRIHLNFWLFRIAPIPQPRYTCIHSFPDPLAYLVIKSCSSTMTQTHLLFPSPKIITSIVTWSSLPPTLGPTTGRLIHAVDPCFNMPHLQEMLSLFLHCDMASNLCHITTFAITNYYSYCNVYICADNIYILESDRK